MILVVSILPYLIGFFALATLAVLVMGLLGMARRGDSYKERSNMLMRWRVSLQGITLALLALHVALTSIY
jgi:hypothetical protein